MLSLQPQVSYRDGQRVVAWEATPPGQQLAAGFSALGFRVSSEEDSYLLLLDDETDQLLLRLYDWTTRLRWHAPQRQLPLFDTLPPVPVEVGDD